MTNWKTYTITRVYIEFGGFDGGGAAKFFLDDYVCYKNGNYKNLIIHGKHGSFIPYRVGDCIEINLDRMRSESSNGAAIDGDIIRSAFPYDWSRDFVRKVGSKAVVVGYSESDINCLKNKISGLEKQKDINKELVSMLNNFSVQMISENFTNNSYFTECDLDNCRQKLKKIVKNVETKKEEQTALVTRSSTDLSVTKESLRLTQVANLALQQQVGEKNQLINAGAITLQTTQTQLTTAQNQNQQKDTQITQLNNDLTTARNQVGQLNTQITVKDNQITQVTNERNTANEQLRLTRVELEELRTLFNNLEIANNNKEQAIKQKEEALRAKEKEIIELRTQLGLLSPEEVLNKKIASGEEELDDLVCTLSLPRQTIKNLRFAYKNLEFNTKVKYNSENITNIDNDIGEIKEELSIFFVENNKDRRELHKIYRSCEQIAKWKVELEQLYQQQYQTRQEQPNK